MSELLYRLRFLLPILALILLAGATITDDDYEIGQGDTLKIIIWRHEDLSGPVKVSPDGEITLPLVGNISVTGKTADQVREILVKKFGSKYIRDPQITVTITDYENFKIFIMGAVAKPGEYRFESKARLLDALITAGGPTEKAGDKATIFRKKPQPDESGQDLETISTNLHKLFTEEDLSQNIRLKNGDVLFVSRIDAGNATFRFLDKTSNRFAVVGEVKKAGSYDYNTGFTVLNAILAAGGLAEFASPNNTMVIREIDGERRTLEVEMGDVLYDGETEKDIPIQPGDLIIVPRGIF